MPAAESFELNPAGAPARHYRSFFVLAPILVVVFLGILRLGQPFAGDQALFVVGAEAIDSGQVLYRDFWDTKQPGIFLFYLLAGKIFGFDELGIHALQLLYMTAFAGFLLVTLRKVLPARLAALAPIIIVGNQYAFATSWHQAQVEFLVPFPLYASLWFAARSIDSDLNRNLFLSGLFAGIVAIFKLLLVPIPMSFWVLALLTAVRVRRIGGGAVVGCLLAAVCGASVAPVLVCLWMWFSGAFGDFLWTTFVWPVLALGVPSGNRVSILVHALTWYALATFPALLIGLFWLVYRRRWRVTIHQKLWLAWLVVGSFVILIQSKSWWDYHFDLIVAPAALLMLWAIRPLAAAIKDGFGGLASARIIYGCMLVALLLPAVAATSLSRKPEIFGFGRAPMAILQRANSREYDAAWRAANFISNSKAPPGPIYVFGTPLIYYLSGRSQAISITGWAWEMQPDIMWDRLFDELKLAKPAYIYVDKDYSDLIGQKSRPVRQLIDTGYDYLSNENGVGWYSLKSGTR